MKPRSLLVIAPLVTLAAACGAGQVHAVSAVGKQRVIAPAGMTGQAGTTGRSGTTTTGACSTRALSLRLGAAGHAAGSLYVPIVFTNTSSTTCTLTGYPGVSFVAPKTGGQVGSAATRNSHLGVHTVTLASGGHAAAMLQVANHLNYPPKTCAATAVSGLRVYPPGQKSAAYVPFKSADTECSGQVHQLSVQAVLRGSTGE
jgi:hypothetical protein